MSKLKKKIPIIILETLEPYMAKGNDKFSLVNPENLLLKFKDNDENSEFYFQIEQYQIKNSKFHLLLGHKPKSKEIVEAQRAWINIETLEQSFNNWAGLIERYDKIKSIYDDPIEKRYSEEFFTEFEIIEEDADLVGFNLEQQLFLDQYLDKVLLALDKHNFDKKDTDLNEIENQVVDLKSKLTILTKKKVVERLANIWAKTRKNGLVILKEIYVEVRNELIKQLIQGQLGK